MKQKLTKLFLMLVVMMLASIDAHAQKTMDVSKFSRLDNDLMARVTKPVRDQDEGKLCALVRVVTNLNDLQFRADALGIVKQESHTGEYWLYVPYGARSLSVSAQGYFPLYYQYALPIEEGTVYELRLSSYTTTSENVGHSANTQMFVLSFAPDEATVTIDDMEVPTEHGVFAAMMSKGDHSFKVTADKYEDASGNINLSDQPVRENVSLQPLFGTLEVTTLPENGFDVSFNGEKVGQSPYRSGKLDPGAYRVHISKDKFYPIDTLVRLREGDNQSISCRLTSFADSLFFNRVLGGRRLSFGVSGGYVIPMVSANSGGSFTGSVMNYSLGNSGEDVDFKSQSGFTFGVFADYRVYKNFYVNLGVNFTQIKFKNAFNQSFSDRVLETQGYIAKVGNIANNYEEKYTLSMLEVPILASYRFVLTRAGSLHLNLGPYLSWGLSAKADISGSSEYSGNMYRIKPNLDIDRSEPLGPFKGSNHVSGELDLYKSTHSYAITYEGDVSAGQTFNTEYKSSESPLKRFNMGLKMGVTYELRAFQLSVLYSLQLTNAAKNDFWEGNRVPLFNQYGENHMSGYKQRMHSLEIKLGYVFRY